ncbi:hypothetical protein [Nocardia sp. R7R-8]|uniref:hypothetical protein n=1 Tax=Nocardia sp. R7R-8 TaxID=3459304 RepID=UPI00403E2EF2
MTVEDERVASRGQGQVFGRLRSIALWIGQLLAVKILAELLVAVPRAVWRWLDL